MITLYTTGLIIALLLVPGVIFRGFFSIFLPLRKFQRTRTEELLFAAKVSIVPFILTAVLAFLASFTLHVPIAPRSGADLKSAFRTVLRSAIDEKAVQTDAQFSAFLDAHRQVL